METFLMVSGVIALVVAVLAAVAYAVVLYSVLNGLSRVFKDITGKF